MLKRSNYALERNSFGSSCLMQTQETLQGLNSRHLLQRNAVEAVPQGKRPQSPISSGHNLQQDQSQKSQSAIANVLLNQKVESTATQQTTPKKKATEKLFPKLEPTSKLIQNLPECTQQSTQKQDQDQIKRENKSDKKEALNFEKLFQAQSSIEPTQFSHQSRFFILDQQISQLFLPQNIQKRKRIANLYQGINNSANKTQQKIPTIQEWFLSLSTDDRVLSLTIVDEVFTHLVMRMQQKINSKGPGKFKLVQRIVKRFNPNATSDQSMYPCDLHQDFQYTSLQALKKDKDEILLQTQQIHEKVKYLLSFIVHLQELLEYIRMTWTDVTPNASNQDLSSEFNTLTVSPVLVQNPQRFYTLIQSIVGQNFLKIPYEQFLSHNFVRIEWDEQRNFFVTLSPIWFNTKSYNSLAVCIIFFLEISLWIHYNAYVKGLYRITKEELNYKIFMRKEMQYVNVRNELSSYWINLIEKSKSENKQILQDLNMELFQRSLLKHKRNEPPKINKLDGGLLLQVSTSQAAINPYSETIFQDSKLMENMIRNQDPQTFMQELCLTQPSKIGSFMIIQERMLVVILRERIERAKQLAKINSNKKNQKKKNKKKTKANKETSANDTSNINQSQTNLQQQNSVTLEKEHKEQVSSDSEEEEVLIENLGEIYSNQDLLAIRNKNESRFQNVSPPQSRRNESELNDLLNELLKEETPKQQPNRITKVKAFYDSIQKEVCSEVSLQVIVQEPLIKPNENFSNQKSNKKNIREDSGANSESTDDVCGHEGMNFKYFMNEKQQQNTPQSQMNPGIELEAKQNSYSSDSGENTTTKPFKNQSDESSSKSDSQEEIKTLNNNDNQAQSQKKLFSKCDIGLSADRSVDETINNFQIIRSNKNFNAQSNQNNNMNQKKKKQKKRSKAVGPQQTLNTQKSTVDQSSRLNTFMRNMISFKDEPLELEETKAKSKDIKTQQSFQSTKLNSERQQYFNSNKQIELTKSESKQLYVKKNPVPGDTSIEENVSVSKNNLEETKSAKTFQEKDLMRKISHHKSIDTKTHSFTKPQKISSRFENFINQKDPSDQQNSFSKQGGFPKDKKKKPANKNKSKNKSFGQSKPAKKSGVYTPNTQPVLHPLQVQQPYIMADQTMNQYMYHNPSMQLSYDSMPHYNMMPSHPQPMDYQNQNGFGNLFQSLDSQGGIQYLQQLLQQALMQQNPTFGLNHDHSYNMYENQMGDYSSECLSQEVVDDKTEHYYDLLQQQMENLVKNIEKKLESVRKERETAISIIENIIIKTYNSSNYSNYIGVKMYGSMASKLAIEQSDVDLTVVGLDFRGIRELQIQEMKNLCHQLDQFVKTKSSLQFIESATVPVIKLQIDLVKISEKIYKKELNNGYNPVRNEIDESMRYLGVDITFEDQFKQQSIYGYEGVKAHSAGIQCISYIQELCMNQRDLKPIVLVLKKLLQMHNLNHPYHGGLNSYSLVLITSAFLKRFSEVQSMSKNMIEFLRYFGYFFDPETTMIDQQDFIKMNSVLPDPMTVIDPLNKSNNTTRSTFRIRDIQEIFKRSYNLLVSKLQEYQVNEENTPDVIQLLLNSEYDLAGKKQYI